MSRQFEHLQDTTLRRLQVIIPADCPLIVARHDKGVGGFTASVVNGQASFSGRFQVVAAYVEGFVVAWRMVQR